MPEPATCRRCFLATVGAGGAAVLLTACQPTGTGDEATDQPLSTAAWADGAARIVDHNGQKVIVLRTGPEQFEARSAVCPHQGCIVTWEAAAEQYVCPCHASRFDRAGQPLSGPASAGLQAVPVRLEDDQVILG